MEIPYGEAKSIREAAYSFPKSDFIDWLEYMQQVHIEAIGRPNANIANSKKSKNIEDIRGTEQFHVHYGVDCQSALLQEESKPIFWLKKRLNNENWEDSSFQSPLTFKKFSMAHKKIQEQIQLEEKNAFIDKQVKNSSSQAEISVGLINDYCGWVYVIRDMESGLYKIGKTDNWVRRFKQLKVDGIKIQAIQLRWVEDRHQVEKYHHDLYDAYRLPQSEWFKLSKQPII